MNADKKKQEKNDENTTHQENAILSPPETEHPPSPTVVRHRNEDVGLQSLSPKRSIDSDTSSLLEEKRAIAGRSAGIRDAARQRRASPKPDAAESTHLLDEKRAIAVRSAAVREAAARQRRTSPKPDHPSESTGLLDEKLAIAGRSAGRRDTARQREISPHRGAAASTGILDEKHAMADRSAGVRDTIRRRGTSPKGGAGAVAVPGNGTLLDEKRAIADRSAGVRTANHNPDGGGFLDEKFVMAERRFKRKEPRSGDNDVDYEEATDPVSKECGVIYDDEDVDGDEDPNYLGPMHTMEGHDIENRPRVLITRTLTQRQASQGLAPGAYAVTGSRATPRRGPGLVTPMAPRASTYHIKGATEVEMTSSLENRNENSGSAKVKQKRMLLFCAVFLTIALAVGLGVGLSGGKQSSGVTGNSTTTTLDNQGMTLSDFVVKACSVEQFSPNLLSSTAIARGQNLRMEYPSIDFNTTDCSNEAFAFWWLVGDDLGDTSNTRGMDMKLERFALASLYFASRGQEWYQNQSWLSDVSACEWTGITCFPGTEAVSGIFLSGYSLNGSLPTQLGLLSQLTTIFCRSKLIDGTIALRSWGTLPFGEHKYR